MNKTALFIINPVAGTRNKRKIPDLIKRHLDPSISYDIRFTKEPVHGTQLTKEYLDRYSPDYIIAVGGDGTANEISLPLVHHKTAMGIIPSGSGNGLSRFLGIPMNTARAIEKINSGKIRKIDVGKVNGRNFLCTAGVGFDAHIGKVFSSGSIKGFWGYAGHVMKEYLHYRPEQYCVYVNETRVSKKAFLITIANAGQYGNNAYISPQSSIDDGYLDLCTLGEFPKIRAFNLGIRLFNRTMHRSPFFNRVKVRTTRIELAGMIDYHLDGEHLITENFLDISIIPQSLKMIAC